MSHLSKGTGEMTRHRVFSALPLQVGATCRLERESYRYLRHVLRLKKNAEIIVSSGTGEEFTCNIEDFSDQSVIVQVIGKVVVPNGPLRITLAQALTKGQKMDYILEKATELGVERIIPFCCARTVPKLTPEKGLIKAGRWQKITREAARQMGHSSIPLVDQIVSFEEMLALMPAGAVSIIFWEEEGRQGIKDVLHRHAATESDSFALVIGPEGGFTREEVELARNKGFLVASLGRQVLKVDSAVITVLAIILYEKGILGTCR